jgi:hypothetical protein
MVLFIEDVEVAVPRTEDCRRLLYRSAPTPAAVTALNNAAAGVVEACTVLVQGMYPWITATPRQV